MPEYEYKCERGHVVTVEAHMGEAPAEITCGCGLKAKRVYHMPMVSLNKWNYKYSFNDVSDELDGDRQATAMGMNE